MEILLIPFVDGSLSAGFESPANDFLVQRHDVYELLVKNKLATFLWRVEGESMIGLGIMPGDIVIEDRSISPVNGDVVVAVVDASHTLKQFYRVGEQCELRPANPANKPIRVDDAGEIEVQGVVTHCIHTFTRRKTSDSPRVRRVA